MKEILLRPLSTRLTAKVDDEDYEYLNQWKWRLKVKRGKEQYVFRSPLASDPDGSPCHILMHKVILRPPEGLVVDHIHGDVKDNRRSELRAVTPAENSRNRVWMNRNNTTGHRNVSLGKDGRYYATHWDRGTCTSLGAHDFLEDAVAAVAAFKEDGTRVLKENGAGKGYSVTAVFPTLGEAVAFSRRLKAEGTAVAHRYQGRPGKC